MMDNRWVSACLHGGVGGCWMQGALEVRALWWVGGAGSTKPGRTGREERTDTAVDYHRFRFHTVSCSSRHASRLVGTPCLGEHDHDIRIQLNTQPKMRGIASLGLLATTRWNNQDAPATAPLWPLASWRPETLQNARRSSSSLERIWSSCRCAGGGHFAFVASMGRLRGYRANLQGGSPRHRRTTAVHRRMVRLGYTSAELVLKGSNRNYNSNDDDDDNNNDVKNINYNPSQQQQQQQQQDDHGTMIIFEIENDGNEDAAALAVYGKLHRMLGTNPSRRLLGPEAVATMTSSNFLVVHHRHGGPWFYEHESKQHGSGDGGGARLALGDRRWDICGIDQKEPSTESLMRGSWKKHETPSSDARRLEGVIESVVMIASRSDVFSVELAPKARPRRKEQEGGANSSGMVAKTRKRLQRFYARVLAEKALVRTSPPKAAVSRNPLMLVGVGALLSRGDCEIILGEARENNDWARWDGDLGEDSEATSLEHLPLSRALWSGEAGDAVRARIGGVYGVPQSSVAVEASDVFVCKAGPKGCGRAEMQERRQGRRQRQQQQQQQQLSAAVEFRRSKSLVSFCVALSAEETPSWAVCVEQRRQCLRPNGQGAGVVFSGKLRHACVTVSPETSRAGGRSGASGGGDPDPAQANPPVVLLRGFASIQHPSVGEDVARWQWGSPAWHMDAPWIKDQDILDRAWVGGGSVGDCVAEAVDETVEGMTLPAETVTAPDSVSNPEGVMERMNTSVAHRYYRQGLGGMDVPVVDPLGRPVIDLVEDGSSWLPGLKRTADVTISAVLRRRFPWDRRRRVGKAGLSTAAGASPRMDAALQELFGESQKEGAAAAGERLVRVPVPPIKYVFVDPRYRGLGLGRRLFLEAMRSLARRGFRFALIIVEDNGSGGLFGFYEEMGFVRADELLGLPRAMIAPIPPPDDEV